MLKNFFNYTHVKHCLNILNAKNSNVHSLFEQIHSQWSEPHRHYHTLEHLNHCLWHLEQDKWGSFLTDKDRSLLSAALWFHDFYYDPKASDNEERSASFAKKSLEHLGIEPDTVLKVTELILGTKIGSNPIIDSDLQNWMNDIDLSILGTDVDYFDRYSKQIRLEYSHVDDSKYRDGRSICMRHILYTPDGIYRTLQGKKEYEDKAIFNVLKHLAELSLFSSDDIQPSYNP